MTQEVKNEVVAKILVVGSEKLLSEEIVHSLMSMGYVVVGVASTADAAIQMAVEKNPNLCLMDIELAKVSEGIEAAERIIREFDIPTVYIADSEGKDALERANGPKPYGCLVKPIELSELKITIRAALHIHEADKRVRECETRYRRILETIAEGVIVQDSQYVIHSYNRVAEALWGVPVEQVLGKSSFDISWHCIREDGSFYPAEEYPFTITLRTGKVFTEAVMGIVHEDKIIWISINTRPLIREGESLPYAVVISFSDITGRKKAEQALRESEERWKAALESVGDGVWDWDTKTSKVFFSSKWKGMLGFEDQEIGDTFDEWDSRLHPDDREATNAELKKHLEGKSPVYISEHRLKCKDGSYKWILARGKIIGRSQDGKPLRLIGTHTDIDGHKQFEKLLQVQRDLSLALGHSTGMQESLRLCTNAAIEASQMDCGGVYLVDEVTGSIDLAFHTGLSDAFVELSSHYEPDSPNALVVMAGQPVYRRFVELGVPVEGPVAEEKLRVIAVVPVSYEGRIVGCLNIASHTLENVSGFARTALETMAGQIGRAITRERVEKALRDSEERYRKIVELSPEGTFIAVNANFAYANPSFVKILGFASPEEIVGKNVFEFLHHQYHDLVKQHIASMLQTGIPVPSQEEKIIRSDGVCVDVEVTAAPIVYQGEQGVQVLVRDITERKRAEMALQESESRVRRKLDAILSPDGDIGLLELSDIIDKPTLQALMDSFYQITKVGLAIVDLRGNILAGTGMQDICTQFHRIHPETLKNCIESDIFLSEGVAPGEFKLYRCKNNMWDLVTPLVMGGRHIGNIFSGGFIFEDETLDYEVFARQARQYGFDQQKYLSALSRVPRCSREKVNEIMAFYAKFADMISSLSYSNIKLARTLTEKNNALDELQQSEEKYRILVENAGEAIYVVQDGRIKFCNKKSEEISGYTSEELTSRSFVEFLYPDDRAWVLERHIKRLQGIELPPYFDLRIINKAGDTRWVTPTIAVIEWEGRAATLNFLTDVTERKQAEEAFRSSQQSLSEIIAFLPDATFAVDRDMRVTIWNRAMEKMTGVSSEEMIGKGDYAYAVPFYGKPRPQLIDLVFQYKEEVASQYPLITRENNSLVAEVFCPALKSGMGVWLHGKASPLHNRQGEVIGAIESIRDITEHKKAVEALRLRGDELAVLNRLARTVITQPSLEEACNVVVQNIAGMLGLDIAVLFIRQGEDLVLRASGPKPTVLPIETIPIRHVGECLCGLAVRTGQSIYVHDISQDERCTWEECKNVGIRSFAAIPLIIGNESVGILGVGSAVERDFQQTASFLETAADTLAVGIHNARLLEETRAYAARLQQNLSELELMQQALRKREREAVQAHLMLRNVLDTIPVRVYWKDGDGSYLGCNRLFARDAGFEVPERVIGKMDSSLRWSEHAEYYRQIDREVMENGQAKMSFEEAFNNPDGEPVVLRKSLVPLRNEVGETIGVLGTYEDITEQKRSEKAIREHEERFRVLFESSADAIIVTDEHFNLIECNEAAVRMFGYSSQAEMLGLNPIDCSPPTQADGKLTSTAVAEIDRQAAEKGVTRFEWMHRRTTGELFPVSVSLAAFSFEGKRRYQIRTQDITERKRVEKAIIESEERFRELFESSPDAILILKDSIVEDCNGKALQLFGYTREEILGRHMKEMMPALQPDGMNSMVKAAEMGRKAKESGAHHFEWVHSRKDGSVFSAEVKLSPVKLTSGIHIQSIVRDITEWKKAIKSLRESEYRFRSFFNSNPEGIVLMDFEGNIQDANKALVAMSGYSLEEMIKRNFSEFVRQSYPNNKNINISVSYALLQDGPDELSYVQRDGSIVPISVRGWVVTDEDSKPVSLGAFMHDVTKEKELIEQKKALEKQVMQTQKMEAIATLAGGIAHDFNNILSGIIGYTELVMEAESSDPANKKYTYLGRVLQAGNRAKDLVQQILRFSRQDSTVSGTISITPIVKESIKLLRSTIPAAIKIEQSISTKVDRITGDPTQIHQVIETLAQPYL